MLNKLYFLFHYSIYKIFYSFHHLGWKVGFSQGVIVKNSKFISLGNSVFIGAHTIIQIPDEYKDLPKKIHQKSPKLTIGNNVTIGYGSMINSISKITIEDSVLIAPLCFIADHGHAFENPMLPIRDQGVYNIAPVTIKKGAWIGTKATISPGVTVGYNAVVGANSVVTTNVPDYSVVVGSPAKIIKQYNTKTKKWKKIASSDSK